MNMRLLIHGVALIILQNILYIEHTVEARNGDTIPLGSLFGSVERRHLKNSQIKPEATSYENEKVQYPQYRKRKIRKKHRIVTHKKSVAQHSTVNIPNRRQEHQKKNKKKPKTFDNKRFIKTTLRENDSKMSGSIESNAKRKPVDIIVHIKMND